MVLLTDRRRWVTMCASPPGDSGAERRVGPQNQPATPRALQQPRWQERSVLPVVVAVVVVVVVVAVAVVVVVVAVAVVIVVVVVAVVFVIFVAVFTKMVFSCAFDEYEVHLLVEKDQLPSMMFTPNAANVV